nr:MAG TPA: hypothetical protein [Caudoviricetes sp.]
MYTGIRWNLIVPIPIIITSLHRGLIRMLSLTAFYGVNLGILDRSFYSTCCAPPTLFPLNKQTFS